MASPPKTRRPRRLFKLTLACASFIATLAITEVFLRASGRFSARDVHSISATDFQRIPGMWEPNQTFTSIEKPTLPYTVTINSLGLRGPETTLIPNKPRILCIGDSFTYGDFVEDDETLPAQIQEQLGGEFEVLNAGVRGTTIVDQVAFLPRLLQLEPDAVVLTYCEPNDLTDLYKATPSHEQMAKDRTLKSGFFSPVFNTFKDTCLFRIALLVRRIWILQPRNQGRKTAETQDPLAKIPQYVSGVQAALDLLKDRNTPLFFVAYPAHGTWSGTPSVRNIEKVLAALESIDVRGIDPTPQFTASQLPPEQLYCLPYDGHPAAPGYALCGQVVAENIRNYFGKNQ